MTLYSHSRLSCFEQCPQRYKFAYIDKVKTDIEQTIEAFTGSRVHETLEKLYRDLMHEKLNTIEDLTNHLNTNWEKNWNDSIIIVKKDYTPENYKKMAQRYIHDYYKKYYPFDQDRTLALEQRIVIPLDDTNKYTLQGYIDRVSDHGNGVYGIHDYKTSRTLPLPDAAKKDRQLALYALGIQKRYPDVKDIHLIWHFLAFNKTLHSTRTTEELKDLKQTTITLIKQIEETTDFPTKTSPLCPWCEFRTLCTEWAHLAKIEDKTVNEYINNPGVQLVNKYMELTHKKNTITRNIDRELGKIKEALIDFSEKEQCEVIFGSDNKIRLSSRSRYVVPKKNTPEREHLENLLKNMDRWEEVSQLNSTALNTYLEEKRWDNALSDMIKEFVTLEKSMYFYPSKITTK